MREQLLAEAERVRERAYAPFSGYKVGAAVLSTSGAIYAGCNVENITYGATTCAERNAVAAMVAAGETEMKEVLVLTRDGGTPCGICRQVLLEFCADPKQVSVVSCSEAGRQREFRLADLLPEAFDSEAVSKPHES
jgi:cytidine deaminase